MGRILDLAREQLRPVGFAHPKMPDGRIERSLFVGRKNGANPPRRQRF
jgi:hypothetical protein